MPPNPKKKSPAGHISDNTPRDWSLVDILEEKKRRKSPEGRKFSGSIFGPKSPEGRIFFEHQIRQKGGKFYLQRKVKKKRCH